MKAMSSNYLSRATNWLLLTTLIYFVMHGAQIFETAAIVPRWAAFPPESFKMFQANFGLDFKIFWIIMHSIHEITFILARIANTTYTGTDLPERAAQWENLNYLRVGLFIAISIGLLPLCNRLLKLKTIKEKSLSHA